MQDCKIAKGQDALEKSTHRRLRIPSVQRAGRTGTAVMPGAVAVPAPRPTTPLRIAVRVGRGLLTLNILLALIVTAVVVGLVGTLLLSLIAQYVIANVDWDWKGSRPACPY